ncbi:MAG TPA: efflux transporter outer membrane subunit [Deltaproteobacteria bacterium]|nr:efflux transporter outer membrane subunit [Deltaproteobacteria bacterium]
MASTEIRHSALLFTGTAWLLLLLSASGCAIAGKDYKRPGLDLNEAWNNSIDGGLAHSSTETQDMVFWWKNLDDPVLAELIERAVQRNTDLRQAKSRLREARAQRSVVKAGFFPTLDAGGKVTRSRAGGDAGDVSNKTMYSTGFDAAWEIDLFGGLRRSVEAAEADLEAGREDVNDVLVSLTAEVALNYVELRMYQARLDVAEKNLLMQEETYQLEQYRLLAGLSDELATAQARSNMEKTRSGIPSLRTRVEQAKNRIAVLLGGQPGSLHEELKGCKPLPSAPAGLALGVPADVLRRRPDVRRAEQELAAQCARVGVAEADLYPRITLNGSIGYDALSTGNLFKTGSRSWSFGPRITWPVFQAGSVRASIEIASARQEQALIEYESVVLSAVEEVENAVMAYVQEQIRRDSLEEAVKAARQGVDFAQNRYDAGLSDFDSLLDAQRTLLSYEDELVQSKTAVITDLISLYKALGGGWSSMVPKTDTSISN